ncbi:MAG: acetate--CoA ligase [Acidobacteria bacterium]|nr:MAG: acetate--CoA ligase [Acidobacteriota bacterium]
MAGAASTLYPPPQGFSVNAHVKTSAAYDELRHAALADPEAFWSARARASLHWFTPFTKVLQWKAPFAQWFVGGETNASFNCLDRHLTGPRRNKAALIWEGENGEQQILTYNELHRRVCQFARALADLGYKKGDRAIIYLPMIPEAAVAMLGCARLGIIHSVVFAGFSSEALRTRMDDLEAQLVITADGGRRRGREVPLKKNVDAALEHCPGVKHSIVFRHTGSPITMNPARDLEWSELIAKAPAQCEAVPVDSEHPLYVLYTSGTTGKPKGVVHSTAGYLVEAQATMEWVFDLHEEDTYWCTADIGWVTGHSYIIYGPLAAGATTLMYEGAPDYPAPDRFWEIIAKYRVNLFYTSPTAIRSFIRAGDALPAKHDLSSLRLLGSVGEPIQPAAWEWYHRVIGHGRCPIVDTWWQTETGGILISPVPGAVATKPGSATLPLPGIDADVVNLRGERVAENQQGYLIIRKPWPSMLRGLYRDPERYQEAYWSRYPGLYFTGDAARRDADGYFWVLGRVDDVINVSGHRMSTMEVESVMVQHPAVAEAAAVGRPDEIKGQALVVFATIKGSSQADTKLAEELRAWVATEIGAFARPEEVRLVEGLPKTRSGKIMRRLLRELVTTHKIEGDTTTIEDYSVLLKLSASGKDEDEILKDRSS